jgi:hypothetical protein
MSRKRTDGATRRLRQRGCHEIARSSSWQDQNSCTRVENAVKQRTTCRPRPVTSQAARRTLSQTLIFCQTNDSIEHKSCDVRWGIDGRFELKCMARRWNVCKSTVFTRPEMYRGPPKLICSSRKPLSPLLNLRHDYSPRRTSWLNTWLEAHWSPLR